MQCALKEEKWTDPDFPPVSSSIFKIANVAPGHVPPKIEKKDEKWHENR